MNKQDVGVKILLSFGFLEYIVHKDAQNSYTVTRTLKVCNNTNIVSWRNVTKEEIDLLTKFEKLI